MAADSPDKPIEPQVRVVDRRWWAREAGDAPADDTPARKPTYVEELERQLADRAQQLQTYMTEHRRALEDFEQTKARIRRDVAREVERGRRAVLVELLDVVDSLDRALAAARGDAGAGNTLLRGVELVRDQFLGKLDAFGVKRVASLGEPFDAARHEAISTLPVDDPSKTDRVVAVVKEGYAIGEEILRPAFVVVGKH